LRAEGAPARSGLLVETPRLLLRPLVEADVPAILEWATDPEVVRNFSFFEKEADPERVRRYVAEKAGSPTDLLLAILEKGPSVPRYSGNVGLHELDTVNLNARAGMILSRDSWGRGMGSEALCGILQHAFRGMGLHKVYLNVFTTNEKGIHIYGKLGFVREGVMRHEYRLRGGWHDMLRMSLLESEWPTAEGRRILELPGGREGGPPASRG
jgi:RimJ/RimL family protein N-acetyltransferase